jgi:hypothetical protein
LAFHDNNHIDLTSNVESTVPSGNSSNIKDANAKNSPNESRKKTHLSPETIKQNQYVKIIIAAGLCSTTRFQIEFKLVYLYFKNYLYINNERKINPE